MVYVPLKGVIFAIACLVIHLSLPARNTEFTCMQVRVREGGIVVFPRVVTEAPIVILASEFFPAGVMIK